MSLSKEELITKLQACLDDLGSHVDHSDSPGEDYTKSIDPKFATEAVCVALECIIHAVTLDQAARLPAALLELCFLLMEKQGHPAPESYKEMAREIAIGELAALDTRDSKDEWPETITGD